MLGSYAISLIGDSHLQKEGGICQDASASVLLPNEWVALLVADGVGSAARSDEGSSAAVSEVGEFLTGSITPETTMAEVPALLKTAFANALEAILKKAEEDGVHPSEFDTTLTVVVYDGEFLAYGHVGDGGVIALTPAGLYRLVTAPMKGEEFNQVVPLRGGGDSWTFGVFDEPVCAVFCATDGIYDVCCPWLLSDQEVPVYVSFMRPFMDNALLKISDAAGIEMLEGAVERYLTSGQLPQVTDDKTVAVCINTEVSPSVRDDVYYAMPDWAALHEAKMADLYDAADIEQLDVASSEATFSEGA